METYEPMPRWFHISEQVANRVVVYSGRTQDNSLENRKRLASIVEVFHPHSEHWEAKHSNGLTPAPGLYDAASVVVNEHLYSYGGRDGDLNFLNNSLYQMSVKTYEWRELSAKGAASPMTKEAAAMVACGDSLALLGGYGIPHGPTQPGSFVKDTYASDGRGWTNEFHIYNLNEGTVNLRLTAPKRHLYITSFF